MFNEKERLCAMETSLWLERVPPLDELEQKPAHNSLSFRKVDENGGVGRLKNERKVCHQ